MRPEHPDFRRVPVTAIAGWLRRGWRDYRRTWASSSAYAAIFAAIAAAMTLALIERGAGLIVYCLAGGFVLIAPVLVPGYYRAAQQLQAGRQPRLGDLLLGYRHAPPAYWFVTFVAAMVFLIWITDALIVYGIYFGADAIALPAALFDAAELRDRIFGFLLAGSLMGLVLAAMVLPVTAFSVPMAYSRRVDLVSAIGASVRAVLGNLTTMCAWGLCVALAMFATLLLALPLFVVVFPVLAYASYAAFLEVWPADGAGPGAIREQAAQPRRFAPPAPGDP